MSIRISVIIDENRVYTFVFDNPYLLQIHVPGRETFGREVELTEGSFTEVRVTFPASSGN